MVKIIFLVLLIFVLFTIENKQIQRGKKPTQYTKVLDILHMVCGIFIALFATVHGIGNLQNVKTINVVTGLIILILLYAEIVNGIFLKSKGNAFKAVNIFHKVIPLMILCMIIVHVVSRGMV
ncbi:hypothetical protein [Thomasclavelia saccharogumia]|uniref:hypothetical protein n=1 Tax=Thomasclavelia saccharogumia TaxID=341225 RepID=UPI00047983AC|nr:hypothetical protein [Thomasclavelia saccharogumia]